MFILLTYVFRVSVGARFSLLCLAHNICVWFLVCNVLHVGRLLVVWICICFVRRCVVCYYLLFPWCLLSSGKWRGVVFVFVWGEGGAVGYRFGIVGESCFYCFYCDCGLFRVSKCFFFVACVLWGDCL